MAKNKENEGNNGLPNPDDNEKVRQFKQFMKKHDEQPGQFDEIEGKTAVPVRCDRCGNMNMVIAELFTEDDPLFCSHCGAFMVECSPCVPSLISGVDICFDRLMFSSMPFGEDIENITVEVEYKGGMTIKKDSKSAMKSVCDGFKDVLGAMTNIFKEED